MGRSKRRLSSVSSWTPRGTAIRTTSSSSVTTAGEVSSSLKLRVSVLLDSQPDVCVCVSSAIKGVQLECVFPKDPSQASAYDTRRTLRHVIFTAETHNFPTGQNKTQTLCVFSFDTYNPLILNGP